MHNNTCILFLSETICNKSSIEPIRIALGFSACFVAQGNGLSGGLALFWYDDLVNVHILSSIGHVDAKITPTYSMPMRQFTGFYGHPTYDARAHTCTLLCQLGILHTLPWLCRGDFNEILSHEKKWT